MLLKQSPMYSCGVYTKGRGAEGTQGPSWGMVVMAVGGQLRASYMRFCGRRVQMMD